MAAIKVSKKTRSINELDAKMNPDVLARAKTAAHKESLNLRKKLLLRV